jgi:hypothetical protein
VPRKRRDTVYRGVSFGASGGEERRATLTFRGSAISLRFFFTLQFAGLLETEAHCPRPEKLAPLLLNRTR